MTQAPIILDLEVLKNQPGLVDIMAVAVISQASCSSPQQSSRPKLVFVQRQIFICVHCSYTLNDKLFYHNSEIQIFQLDNTFFSF